MQTKDKVFVVTDAGNGIGREVALELLRRGDSVAGVDLRSESLAETAALATAGDRFTQHELNIADQEAVELLPMQVAAQHGHVDGLLNVAGIIQKFVLFKELDLDEMRKVMDVNFWGTVYLNKAFIPHLTARPEASLVNVSSMGGFLPVPGQTVYGASKAAVKLLTEGIYAELRETSVATTIVFPGAIATNITGNSGVSSPGGAKSEEEAKKEAESSKLKPLPADEAAKIIADQAVEKGRFRVTVGKDATMLDTMARIAPQRATDLIAKKMASLIKS